ncbi:MAG TPA: hypothetical protein VK116_05100 [Planctomycetota bacterium]|nr:hypothetical protein [Planctomycetota bacterium]
MRFELPDAEILACASEGTFFLTCEHDIALTACSFRIEFDPSVVAIDEVSAQETSLIAVDPEGPDFFSGTIQNGVIVWGVVFGGLDGSDPREHALPPGRHTIARFTYRPVGDVGSQSAIELANEASGGNSLERRNVVTDTEGESVSPVLDSGSVRILPGTIRVGIAPPSHLILSGERVTLSARETTSSCVGEPSFAWAQVGGPAVLELAGTNAPEVSFLAPTVDGDTPLTFELKVTIGEESETSIVEVEVVDPFARRGGLAQVDLQTEDVDLPEHGGPVAFSGQVSWATPFENGRWRGVRFLVEGDLDALSSVSSAGLYLDENGDGQIGTGDRELARLEELAVDDEGKVLFSFDETLLPSESRTFALVLELAPQTSAAGFPLPLLATALVIGTFTLLARRLRRRSRNGEEARILLGIVLLAFIAFGAAACGGDGGGGGGGGSKVVVPGTLRFSIDSSDDVILEGEETGLSASMDGLPATGPQVDVR